MRVTVSDREIARTIRREIVRDKKLSTYVHNVKIHVEGQVTLRGLAGGASDKDKGRCGCRCMEFEQSSQSCELTKWKKKEDTCYC